MGLENSDYIAIAALIFTFFTFIIVMYRTRKKGPIIDLYHAKKTYEDLYDNGKTFHIGVSVWAENIGDKAANIILDPEMIAFDEYNQQICSTKDHPRYKKRIELKEDVPVSKAITINATGYFPPEAEKWKIVKINFNAYYFKKKFLRKKWKEKFVTNNEFTLEK